MGQWLQVARTLPWRDRWRLHRSAATGRAVAEPRLARLAVRRAEVVVTQNEWVLVYGALPRRLRLASVVIWLLVAAANLAAWLLGGPWFNLVLTLVAPVGDVVGSVVVDRVSDPDDCPIGGVPECAGERCVVARPEGCFSLPASHVAP